MWLICRIVDPTGKQLSPEKFHESDDAYSLAGLVTVKKVFLPESGKPGDVWTEADLTHPVSLVNATCEICCRCRISKCSWSYSKCFWMAHGWIKETIPAGVPKTQASTTKLWIYEERCFMQSHNCGDKDCTVVQSLKNSFHTVLPICDLLTIWKRTFKFKHL